MPVSDWIRSASERYVSLIVPKSMMRSGFSAISRSRLSVSPRPVRRPTSGSPRTVGSRNGFSTFPTWPVWLTMSVLGVRRTHTADIVETSRMTRMRTFAWRSLPFNEERHRDVRQKVMPRITVRSTSARPVPWLVGSQEQTQIITSAIGRPTPNAPPTINANAESKLSSAWTARLDMPLLHRAPTSTARRPKDERKKARVWSLPEPERFKAESLWLRKS
jgi:hypothetical protein